MEFFTYLCRQLSKTTKKEIPVKEHTHNYATTLSSDAESHWYECECGDKKDIVAHDFSIAGEDRKTIV